MITGLTEKLDVENPWEGYVEEKLQDSTIFWNPEALNSLEDGLVDRIKVAIDFDPNGTTRAWDELWGNRSALRDAPVEINGQTYAGIKWKGILFRRDGSNELSKEEANQLLYHAGVDEKVSKKRVSGKEIFSKILPKINFSNDSIGIKNGEIIKGFIENGIDARDNQNKRCSINQTNTEQC